MFAKFVYDAEATCEAVFRKATLIVFRKSPTADVIRQPFHRGHSRLKTEGILDPGQVVVGDLSLQCPRGRRDYDFFPALQCGQQISQGFSRAGAGLTEQHPFFLDGPLDSFSHFNLRNPRFVVRVLGCKGPVRAENGRALAHAERIIAAKRLTCRDREDPGAESCLVRLETAGLQFDRPPRLESRQLAQVADFVRRLREPRCIQRSAR